MKSRIALFLILTGVMWIPAFAGMTVGETGIVLGELGMTKAWAGPVTDVSYSTANPQEIERMWSYYGAVPGGITLEGTAHGFPDVRQATYNPAENAFILNKGLRYASPVSRAELREIVEALEKEGRLGVGFQQHARIYGALRPGGEVAEALKAADLVLGRKILGLPSPFKEKGTGVYFRLDEFRFAENAGELKPESSAVRIMLVPLLRETDENGNFLPDYETLNSGLEQEKLLRARELARQLEEDPGIMEKIIRYGEVAAFLRALKAQNMDFNTLTNRIKGRQIIAASA